MIAERYRFYVRNQAAGESISEYVAALKKMSQNCEFGQFLQDVIRDRLVCGLKNDHIQKRLLSEDKRTFEKALNLSVAMETSAKDTQELSKREVKQGVHKLAAAKGGSASSGKNPSSVGTSNSESSCWRCGRKHSPDQCWFKEEICRKCKTTCKGYIQRMCKKQRKNFYRNPRKGFYKSSEKKKQGFYYLDERSDSTSGSDSEVPIKYIEVQKLEENDKSDKPIEVSLKENEVPLTMELGTGSGISVISKNLYEKHFTDCKLKQTGVVLNTYTKEPVIPLGIINVKVKYQEKCYDLELFVVDSKGPPLLGRSCLRHIKLDWRSSFSFEN